MLPLLDAHFIRHEIIALHEAYEYPGAQFYPSCIQLQVTGSGTALPTSFVSFPGAYTPTTPGIVFDVYTSKFSPNSHLVIYQLCFLDTSAYPIPGPAV